MNLAELFKHETDLLTVPAGETIFHQGAEGEYMYVLLSGTADVVIAETVVEKAESGALIGEMALIDKSPRAATVVAATECKLVPIDTRRFHFLVTQTPNFATHVMKVMADRLRRMDTLVVP